MNMIRICLACVAMFYFQLAEAEVPQQGAMAPVFALKDQNNRLQRLEDYRGKWVVLYFYPKDDTPGCTKEACSFRDDLHQLTALGAQVLGVSVDDVRSHAEFASKYHLPFPLLADVNASTAKAYGAFSDWVLTKYAKRYTFLIDPAGRVAKAYLDVDTSLHSGQIISDLKLLGGQAAR